MDNIKDYSYSIAKQNSKKLVICGMLVILFTLMMLGLFNTVLKDKMGEELDIINKFLIGISSMSLVLYSMLPLIFFNRVKKALDKLPIDIDEIWRKGTQYNNMKNFVFGDEGLISFIDANPIYIKYTDMQRAYVYKFSQKVLFIPVVVSYFINIETVGKNYSIPVKNKMNGIKYTKEDFSEIILEIGKKNEHIVLGYE